MKYEEFISKIKSEYPEYSSVEDSLLAERVLEKYPDYKQYVEDPVPYVPVQIYPDEMPKVEFDQPEEGQKEEPTFWSEFKRTGHRSAVRIAGDVTGAALNIAGTIREGQYSPDGIYAMPGIIDKESEKTFYDVKYVGPEEAKRLTEENVIFQAGNKAREWSKQYIENHPELQDPENMEELSWGTFYKPSVLGRIIGDGSVSLVAGIGSGMIGTAIGGPIVGMSTAMAAGGAIEGASAYTTVKEYGNLSYEDQAKVAVLVSMTTSLIAALPASNIIGKMGLYKPFQQDVAKKIIKKGLYKNIGTNALKQGLAESVEESLQEAVHITAETSYMEDADEPTWNEIWSRIGTNMYAGHIMGTKVGLTLGGYQTKQQYDEAVFQESEIGQEINRAKEEKVFDEVTINVAENFARQNPQAFEGRSVLSFIEETREITREQLTEQGIDPDEFFTGEGLKEGTEKADVLGSTLVEDGKVLINLYEGANPTTVIEEFYGNAFRNLSKENAAIFEEHYNLYIEEGGKLTKQEFFEKQGSQYYFDEQLYKTSTIGKVYRKVKNFFNKIFNRTDLQEDVRIMYEDAGFGKVDENVIDGIESFEITPKTFSIHSIIEDTEYPTFNNIDEIASHLSQRSKKLQEKEGVDLTDMSDDSKQIIAETLAAEIKTELENPANAGSWYTKAVSNAFKILKNVIPEIDNSSDKSKINVGIAVTSNGTAVQENLSFGVRAWEWKKENGEFPTHFQDMGTETKVINQSFKLYNDLANEMGEDALVEFLNTEFDIKELTDKGFKVSGELVNTKVPGAIIFGPKIGGAFYANLQGDLSRLTMDRWFTRTWGRITGTIQQEMTPTIKKNFTKFKSMVRNSKKRMEKYGLSREDTFDDAKMLVVAKKVFREFGKDWKKDTTINKLSRSIVMNTGIENDPRTGTNRANMRDVMSRTVEILNDPNISIADAQALLWFPEKRLFSKLRGKPQKGSEELDYEEAAKNYARERGVSDARIEQSLREESNIVDQEDGQRIDEREVPQEQEVAPTIEEGESFQLKVPDDVYNKVTGKVKKIDRDNFVKTWWEKSIIPISTRLERIHPKLKDVLRVFEFNSEQNTMSDMERAIPFLERFNQLPDKDRAKLDLALKNSDFENIDKFVKEYGLEEDYMAVRDLLNSIYNRAKDSGMNIKYLFSYFPRQVKNYDKLLAHFNIESQAVISKQIDKAYKEKGEELSMEEKSTIVNQMLTQPQRYSLKTKHGKNRVISYVDEELNQFYEDPATTLVNYIASMNESIAFNNFFGEGKNQEESIGLYLAKLIEDGDIDPSMEKEAMDLLKARFYRGANVRGVPTIKNLTNIALLGNIGAAITQFGDLYTSWANAGLFETVKGLGKAISRKNIITQEDIGINRIAAEFESHSKLANLLNKVFKGTGFARMDRLGKETLINATLGKFKKQAKRNNPKLKSKVNRMFGDESKQVWNDLKAGRVSENVKMLLFGEVLDFQPIALSEMPQAYLENKSGYGRLFYQLKTFTIKQLDVFRRNATDDIRIGFKKNNKKQIAKGIGNLIRLSVIYTTVNMGADRLKDLIFGREAHFDDYLVDNLFRLIGMNKWMAWKIREDGPVALWQYPAPPMLSSGWSSAKDFINLGKAVYDEEKKVFDEFKNMESFKFIPFVGKSYYWWFGGGSEKVLKQEIQRYKDIVKGERDFLPFGPRPLTQEEQSNLYKVAAEAESRGIISEGTYNNILRDY